MWPKLIEHTSLGLDLFLAIAMIPVIWLLLSNTTLGFRLRLTGANEAAASFAGIRTVRVTVLALLISGGSRAWRGRR
ncbi:MAG: hypothetical protein U0V56_06575 [Actinomycetota bacterium]